MTHTKVTLRALTPRERRSLEQLAASRTAQARFVERAQIVVAIADGQSPGAEACQLLRYCQSSWMGIFRRRQIFSLRPRR